MKTGRLLSVAMVICVLFVVCGANQANMDAFQLRRRTDQETESGQATERMEEYAENEQTTDGLPIRRESPRLAEMAEEQSEALEGYASFLTEYAAAQKEDGGEKTSVFTLIFLDGDEVPELVVMDGDAHLCEAFVYRFEEGRAVPAGSYGQYGTLFYREKEGIVLDSYDSFGDVYDDVYQIEGGQITHLQSFSERTEISETEGEWLDAVYTVDGKEVSREQYQKVHNKWYEADYREITYDMCRTLSEIKIREELQEELEDRISTQEEVLKQNILLEAGAQEDDILLFAYDDYDGNGSYEAFMLVGNRMDSEYDWASGGVYDSRLYFASVDRCELVRDNDYGYRMIEGKMEFSSGRKYLFFDTDQYTTANVSELWTVRDKEPVEESGLLQMGEVSYRGGDEFEIWVDAYDWEHDIDAELDIDCWVGHTWKPYFYHYNSDTDQLEAYDGESISKEAFAELSETTIIEEIEAKGYTIGEIIHWGNDIVTINYHYDTFGSCFYYENVIWDNNLKEFWRKDERGVTSWEDAGVGGSYGV